MRIRKIKQTTVLKCQVCGRLFETKRPDFAKFCSVACQKRDMRVRHGKTPKPLRLHLRKAPSRKTLTIQEAQLNRGIIISIGRRREEDTASAKDVRPLPIEPTIAPPGSMQKIAVLHQRAMAGVDLWHPDDAPDCSGDTRRKNARQEIA